MPTNNESKIDAGDILIVDDEIPNLQLLTQVLSDAGYQALRSIKRPKLAIESALAQPPSLILLDVRMPEMDGFEVCRRLKQEAQTRDIPIIFVSALQDVQDRVRGFEAGGVDFISKPFQEPEVLARVRTHLALRNMQLHLEEIVAKRTTDLENEISERIEAEDKIRQSEEKFRTLITNIPDATWTTDRKGKTVFISSNILGIYGYSPEELCGMGKTLWFKRIHPDDVENVKRAFGSLFDINGFRYDIEYRIKKKDGQWIWLHDRSIATYKKDGVAYADGILTDITNRKQAEENLSKSETKYRGLVDTSLVGVFHSRINGQLVFVNEALARMFDFDSPEQMVVEGSISRWKDPNRRELFLATLREQGYANNFETETITRKGRPIHVLFSATLDGDNISGMVMDITERKLAEQKVIDYQQRLKALATQLTIAEEKERRVIATDLHDQVGYSLSLANMQLNEILEVDSVVERTLLVKDISNILLKALQDTRSLIFELSSPTMNEIGLAAAISEWLEEQIAKRHDLKIEFIDATDDNHKKTLDSNVRALLFRNVRELLTNVIKHSRAQNVRVQIISEGSCLKITVEDDGVGFNPDADNTKQKAAEGFGLFSIQERMADLGGSFDIQSHPGKGCRMTLISPPIVGKG
jgi:PAS domain S-box-containing protein